MAGLAPLIPTGIGFLDGKLDIRIEKSLSLDELLTHLPDARSFIDEIAKKGWRFFFIEGFGEVLMELEIRSSPYTLQVKEHPRGGLSYTLLVDFGRFTPRLRLKGVINLQRFIVNISSEHHPRAITVDLAKNQITYVHDSIWFPKGEEGIEEAKGVFKILRWLTEEKNFKLGVSDGERYRELLTLLGGK